MANMVITAPRGYNVAKFMDIVSELSRARFGSDYDLNLGDHITCNPRTGEYELDCALVTPEQLDIIRELQEICPVNGKDADADFDIFTEIVNQHRDEFDKRESLDLFLNAANRTSA